MNRRDRRERGVEEMCECVSCCNGDHPGWCRECAGWGDVGGEPCDHCAGSGDCPVCMGGNKPDSEPFSPSASSAPSVVNSSPPPGPEAAR
jgi:hypothetical protein